jgi:molybdopterin-guanine dinucleotide biosynthesis protein A
MSERTLVECHRGPHCRWEEPADGAGQTLPEGGGESVFDRTLSLLMDTFVETVVVLAEPIESLEVRGCRVVYDVIPNAGSLGGLYTGLIGGLAAEDICRSL